MKLFKVYLILFAIVASFVGISRFFSPAYLVQESIVVNKPLDATFAYMSNLKKWEDWSLWNKSLDSTLTFFYNQKYDTLGGRQYFAGEQIGLGYIETVTFTPGQSFSYRLYAREGDITANGAFNFREVGAGQTEISWLDSGNVGNNPIKRYMIPVVTKSTHETFRQGLEKIKAAIEQ
jgi:hypothetical protein